MIGVISLIRTSPNATRTELINQFSDAGVLLEAENRDRLLNMAIEALFMISCGQENHGINFLETLPFARSWNDGTTLSQFTFDSFPMTDCPSLNDHESSTAASVKAALTAKKLIKHAHLSFCPTDDIRDHLRLDGNFGTVKIFHYTSFLKEHLRATKTLSINTPVDEFIRHGTLPRQLVPEVIDSIQKILFPLADPKSYALLQSLTSSQTCSFDPDCLRFESANIRHPDEKDIAYYYLGSRLMDLHEEFKNPNPHSFLGKWLERRSGARYVMLATLAGAMVAVLLGIFGLAVTSYQTWIAYQQWKHPGNSGS